MNFLQSKIFNDLVALAIRVPVETEYYSRRDNLLRDFLLDLGDCVAAIERRKRDKIDNYLGRNASTARSAKSSGLSA